MDEESKNNTQNLVEGSTKEALVRMTTPMIIGMLMLFTFSLVDTWFISFLGTDSLTAISFTFPVTFTVMSLAIGLGIGASAVVASLLGSSQFDKAKEAATVINYISLAMALLIVMICWTLTKSTKNRLSNRARRFVRASWRGGFSFSVFVLCL